MTTFKTLTLIAVLSTPCLFPALAQQARPPGTPDPRPPANPQTSPATASVTDPSRRGPDFRMGALREFSKIKGSRIKNTSGTILGDIDELAVNLSQGEITTVIISTGGILGVGERLVALPPQALNLGVDGEVHADVDMERWSNAPDFDPQDWKVATHPDRVSANARYFTIQPRSPYGQQTTTTSPDATRTTPASNPPLLSAHVVRASELMGKKVLGETGETIGDVEDLIVDLSWGRIAQVIVSSGGFLGFNEELSAIPPVLFVQDPDQDHLTLKANKALLTSAPRFNNGQWKDHASPEAVSKVYSAYRLQPYFDPTLDADGNRLEVRERVHPTPPGAIQDSSKADVRIP